MPPADRLVAIRCDGTATRGMGHVMRCLALAEGLVRAGLRVTVVGEVSGPAAPWQHLRALEVEVHSAPETGEELVVLLLQLGASALVIDSYEVPADVYSHVRQAGLPVTAIVDAPAPRLPADLLVNQNVGAERAMGQQHSGSVLAGPRYALLRGSVIRRRPASPMVARDASRALVVLGGTDVHGAAPQVARLLIDTGEPLHIDVVCATPELLQAVRALPSRRGQKVVAHRPLRDLGAAVGTADVVVSAAGTTTLEIACLGTPMALLTVADNQVAGCRAMVEAGAAISLGRVEALERAAAQATDRLSALLRDAGRRAAMASAGHRLVDGQGRDRVAAAVSALLSA